MRSVAIALTLGIFQFSAFCADPKYPISEIPEDLRKDVNAVVREDQMVYQIHARNRASLKVLLVATIFNKNGMRYALPKVGYDKLSKITSFKGNVYDAYGNLIRRLKSSEIQDKSAYDGFSLYSDNRYKAADLSHGVYPYTVEFEYEIDYNYLYAISGSFLVSSEKVSVQHFSYQLLFPPDLKPRYKVLNMNSDPVQTKVDGMESLTWSFENIKPVKEEPLGPDNQFPQIIAAPSKFEYEGYEGDMSTWESYGTWKLELLKGRDALSPATQQKVLDLTKGLSTTEEKAKVLYEYLQGKTRYVSIQLGIGGLQPFPASVVDQSGYGDCKALSNYMVSMLKTAGITGYYTTVKAGDFEFDLMEDFPSHQSNHVVVAVPNGADTLWLECTSQRNPFGYAGKFTGDRKAFMLTEKGGIWVQTPRYTVEQNLQSRSAQVEVSLTGDAQATIKTTYAGLQYENDNLNFVLGNQINEQKEWVEKTTDIPSFEINSFRITEKRDRVPSARVDLELNLRRFATLSGKRLFLTPNLMNRSTFVPEKVENRKTKVVRRFAYTDIDTIRYKMPEGIYPEFLPQPTQFKSRFGDYESSVQIVEGDVLYIRKVKMFKGEFPPEFYNELIEFYKNINKADNQKLVFLSKT
jgi:hypothetical protein